MSFLTRKTLQKQLPNVIERNKCSTQKLYGNSEHSRLPASLQTTENTYFILYSNVMLSIGLDLEACRKLLLFS